MIDAIDLNEMQPIARPLLPVIFVLDSSGSMQGQKISMLNHTMEECMEILKRFAASNPDALMKIGVLELHSGADWMQPSGLEDLEDFVFKRLEAGGLTDMGAVLNELDDKLSRQKFLVSTTGRCKPIIIFMTDGYPTDSWEEPLRELKNNNKWYKNAIRIGFAVGDDADVKIITEIVGSSEAVIQTSDLQTFSKLLLKVAINSAMIGSKSHIAGDVPDGASIVQGAIKEAGEEDNARTAGDMGIRVIDPIVDDEDDDWGEDWD